MIARGLSAFNPDRVALAAGKIMPRRLRDLAAERTTFAFETTLASRSFAPWIAALVRAGYDFRLLYVFVDSADVSVARVAQRVRTGGHDVPEETIRRRYVGGLRNFDLLYRPLAKTWRVYDNSSGSGGRRVANGSRGRILSIGDLALWAKFSRAVDEAKAANDT